MDKLRVQKVVPAVAVVVVAAEASVAVAAVAVVPVKVETSRTDRWCPCPKCPGYQKSCRHWSSR